MLWPESSYRQYQVQLLDVIGEQEDEVAEVQEGLLETFKTVTGQRGEATDADPENDPQIQRRLKEVEDRLGQVAASTAFEDIAEQSVRSIVENVNLQFENDLEQIAGVDPFRQNRKLEQYVTSKIQDQVELISTLPDRHFDEIREKVFNGVRAGWDPERLAEEIPRTGSTMRFNATRIARDQTGTMQGEMTKERHNQAGLKTAVWDTIGDNRVRPDHEALNGRTFVWEEGAGSAGIIPGEEIMCRCTAQVNFMEASSKFPGQQETATQ